MKAMCEAPCRCVNRRHVRHRSMRDGPDLKQTEGSGFLRDYSSLLETNVPMAFVATMAARAATGTPQQAFIVVETEGTDSVTGRVAGAENPGGDGRAPARVAGQKVITLDTVKPHRASATSLDDVRSYTAHPSRYLAFGTRTVEFGDALTWATLVARPIPFPFCLAGRCRTTRLSGRAAGRVAVRVPLCVSHVSAGAAQRRRYAASDDSSCDVRYRPQ